MTSPVLLWFRRDLRCGDNPALTAAIATGRPVLPIFILDPNTESIGAAAKWRLGLSLRALQQQLQAPLILRRGPPLDILRSLIAETGAKELHYGRDYTAEAIARDTEIKSTLTAEGISVTSHNSLLLFEPWTVSTGAGGYYKVYTPFWNAVRGRAVAPPLPAPVHFASPPAPPSDNLSVWGLDRAMQRGAAVVSARVQPGENRAHARLRHFLDQKIDRYRTDRDRMDMDATSGLSENLTWGEISPRSIWHAGQSALAEGRAGAEHFLKELVWREFAYHLLFHAPDLGRRNWREGWDSFNWRGDNADALAWKQGRTGEPIVDAAMRELYVTGRMHNRARMIVGSYLTKHLMTDWRVGLDWFADCLVDWDPAANAMGWQWIAGCGPDAAPYFRVFNPALQAEKFDPDHIYRDRFLNHRAEENSPARAYFDAIPRAWNITPDTPDPDKIVDLKQGRDRALAAYHRFKTAPAMP